MAWQHEMVTELRESPESKAITFEVYARKSGLSVRTLYRIAEKFGFASGRKERADKGIVKCGLTEEQILYVAGLIYKTGRENKGGIMPVEAALEIAYDNGIIERGQVSVGTMCRLLRERQLDSGAMREADPHTEMRSLHPNHVHLVDVSVCIQYYLKNGRMGIMDERDFYRNKPDAFAKIKQKLLRYAYVDHFSGIYYFRYYIADGESRENLFDFLLRCWRLKNDPRLALRGVPFIMLMDAGSGNKAGAIARFMDALKIERPKGKPYNPRRQGGVEQHHNIIERWFETKLRIQPAWDVDILNQWAEDFMIWFHATRKHTRHGMTRLESWQLIQPEQLRECPDDDVLQLIYTEPEVTCTVRNYKITYQTVPFNLKHLPGIHQGAQVTLMVNPYRWKQERVVNVLWKNEIYEVAGIEKLAPELGGFSAGAAIIGQEYKAQPSSPQMKSRDQINEIAHGTREPSRGSVPFDGTIVFGNQADKVGNLVSLPRRGTVIEMGRQHGPIMVSVMDVIMRVRAEIGSVSPELNKRLRTELGESVAADLADRVVAQIAETGTFSIIESEAAQGGM